MFDPNTKKFLKVFSIIVSLLIFVSMMAMYMLPSLFTGGGGY